MRILVLGGTGMLGHKMTQVFQHRYADTWVSVRHVPPAGQGLLTINQPLSLDVSDLAAVDGVIRDLQPDVIVNCTGVIKQRDESLHPIPSITVNALLPHRLAAAQAHHGGRLIHFSTDCVFRGTGGQYTESDPPDAPDLYGRSKALGEPTASNALCLRTSIIGRELTHWQSLLEWFLAQQDRSVKGFRHVWWSGVTTNYLAELTATVIDQHPQLTGLFHIAGHRITKYDLLLRLRAAYDLNIDIEPDDTVVSDKSLSDTKFVAATGLTTPPWDVLIPTMAADPTPYPKPGSAPMMRTS